MNHHEVNQLVKSSARKALQLGLRPKSGLALLILGLILFELHILMAISPEVLPVVLAAGLDGTYFLAVSAVSALLACGLIGCGFFRIGRSLPSVDPIGGGTKGVLPASIRKVRLEQGLRIVAIGGGTGQATLLRGLKHKTSNLTSIVAITDDGGSSGRLRSELSIPPPGDARNCLVALSEAEPLMQDLFQYRFNNGASLDGHNLGNLLLAALYDMRGGFQEALEAAAQLLALSGIVVPVSSQENLVLMGETVFGQVLRGESAIGHAPDQLSRVWIEPVGGTASGAALKAIQQAQLIVIGPGSLYTSIIPNFLLGGISEAIAASSAPKVFVCNVATQQHETDGYGVTEHLKVFQEHTGVALTHVVVNTNVKPLPEDWGQVAVSLGDRIDGINSTLVLEDVVDEAFRTRHDPGKLADVLESIVSAASNCAKPLVRDN